MCDLAYLWWWESLERQVLADRQALAVASVLAGVVTDLPTVDEARVAFDEWLIEEPTVKILTPEEARMVELKTVLGLRVA